MNQTINVELPHYVGLSLFSREPFNCNSIAVLRGRFHEMNLRIAAATSTKIDILEKKRLGAFYTPERLSDVLAKWAIRLPNDLVLEPSFGGCGFLKSAADQLKLVNSHVWQRQLYGCDIDKRAFKHLASTFGGLVNLSNFHQGDFLRFDGTGWTKEFHAVIGNPPYLPYQSIERAARDSALEKLAAYGFKPDLRSSLWLYFVALGLTYLGVGGRIAWVLPGSFTQANYATTLRAHIARRFKKSHAFIIKERLFLYEGTDEQTIVLLAEGFSKSDCNNSTDIGTSIVADIAELTTKIEDWDKGLLQKSTLASNIVKSTLGTHRAVYDDLCAHLNVNPFSKYADVRIGLVTGDNKFFVLNRSSSREHGIHGNALRPLLAKFSSATGLKFMLSDHEADKVADRKCLLVSAATTPAENEGIENYLNTFPKNRIKETATFKKRRLWCLTDDKNPPDAFFPVMHHLGPRLVLNDAGINCTNTLHRVYFKAGVGKTLQKLISISLLSTFSQISAEIEGRKYGSGVLKHEPREAERIQVLIPEIDRTDIDRVYSDIDKLLRAGKSDEARMAADRLVISSVVNRKPLETIEALTKILAKLRKLRHANRKVMIA